MGVVRNLIIAVLLISFVTFVALFGRLPAFRKTPIGFIHRLIWIKLPGLLLSIDRRLTRGKFTWYLKRSGYYLMNENHPLILIFYMAILLGSECLFIPPAWPRLGSGNRALIVVLTIAPYIFTYKCVRSTSSMITARNHEQEMRRYPYDHVLFHPGHVCRTCQFLKPARSKHCSICKACIAKSDHHCVWVMNCLGKDNYAFFIAMLLSLSTLLSYGAYISYMLLDRFLQESLLRRAQGMYGRSHWSVGRSWNEYFQLWAWSFSQEIRLGGVGMLALLTAPLAFGLFIYHIYLIWAGMTTNESFKWAEWKDDVFDGFVYKEDDAVAQRDSIMSDPELEPRVAWPLARRQVLINRANRQSPHYNYYMQSSTEWDNTRSLSWKRVNSMSEVENIYDLGFWTNIRDVLGLQLSNFPVLVAGSDQQ